jgi:hypothetical protein
MSELIDPRVMDFLNGVGGTSMGTVIDALRAASYEHLVTTGHRPERVTVTDRARGAGTWIGMQGKGDRIMAMEIEYLPLEPRTAVVSTIGAQTEVTW